MPHDRKTKPAQPAPARAADESAVAPDAIESIGEALIPSAPVKPQTAEPIFTPGRALEPGSHRRRRMLLWGVGSIAVVLVCVPALLWVHYQAVNVLSRNATTRGNLVEIGTRLDGVLGAIEANAGARVKAGQVLARLEDRRIQAETQTAQAELSAIERELAVERAAIAHEQRMLESRSAEARAAVSATDAKIAAAVSRANDAEHYYQARSALLRNSAISREEVRDADAKRGTLRALVDVAKANAAAARSAEHTARIELEGLVIRQQRMGVLEANVTRAEARLESARADLEASVLRAPSDGGVVRWLIHQGGSVKVGLPIVAMWAGSDVWIEAWIDEGDISKIRVGDPAIVTLPSVPGGEFGGLVDKIGLTTDYELPPSEVPQPRFARMRGAPVVGVLVRLESPPPELFPGLSAEVAIQATANEK